MTVFCEISPSDHQM